MEPITVALITASGVVLSAVIGVISTNVGAQATRDSAEVTSRGEEWERILQTVREVSRSELELRDSQIERLRRDVDEQSERMRRWMSNTRGCGASIRTCGRCLASRWRRSNAGLTGRRVAMIRPRLPCRRS